MISPANNKSKGYIKGTPRRFVHGHHVRVKHPMQGKRHTEESKAKISASGIERFKREDHPMLGKSHTEESKAAMSEARLGIPLGPQPQKYGDSPGYMAVHNWVRRHHVKTGVCEACGAVPNNGGHGTQWANISGEYRRDRADFWELCTPCHKIFDYILRIEQADPELIAVMRAKRGT